MSSVGYGTSWHHHHHQLNHWEGGNISESRQESPGQSQAPPGLFMSQEQSSRHSFERNSTVDHSWNNGISGSGGGRPFLPITSPVHNATGSGRSVSRDESDNDVMAMISGLKYSSLADQHENDPTMSIQSQLLRPEQDTSIWSPRTKGQQHNGVVGGYSPIPIHNQMANRTGFNDRSYHQNNSDTNDPLSGMSNLSVSNEVVYTESHGGKHGAYHRSISGPMSVGETSSYQSSIPGLVRDSSGSTTESSVTYNRAHSWQPSGNQKGGSSLAAAVRSPGLKSNGNSGNNPPPGFNPSPIDEPSYGRGYRQQNNCDKSRNKRNRPKQRRNKNVGKKNGDQGRGQQPLLRERNFSSCANIGNTRMTGIENQHRSESTLLDTSELKALSSSLQRVVSKSGGKGINTVGGGSSRYRNDADDDNTNGGTSSRASSEAIRVLMKPSNASVSTNNSSIASALNPTYLDMESSTTMIDPPILPKQPPSIPYEYGLSQDSYDYPTGSSNSMDDDDYLALAASGVDYEEEDDEGSSGLRCVNGDAAAALTKKKDWLARMNRKLSEVPVGELDPSTVPLSAIMNAWAKTKSAHGASMVETWLKRAQQEYSAGNTRIVPTAKMYTMAVDAWARSGERGAAARRAEALLHHMNQQYQSGEHDSLKPTTGIFNAVINAWARSREHVAPVRAEQILTWMENFKDLDIQPDKYTYNTVIHAWAKAGGTEAAIKAQHLLSSMDRKYQEGNKNAKPDTITYNVVINAWAKSGGKGAAQEAEKLLSKIHRLYEMGDVDVKPSVVTYGAVIDAYAKSGEKGSAARADMLLAQMIQLHQSDPVKHADMLPNTYVFNTVINCWAKSKEHDAASKAEEMLVAMSRLHASGIPNLKPDAFTYTAVIDAWAKSGYVGAALRADQLLDKMEAKYMAGDADLKPNTFTYNAVINALAKSGEVGAAARAERVLQNMVNRYRSGSNDDIKPTTINFNTVLDAWAKSQGGRAAAERAEEILEWMDHLYKGGNADVKPDTITFNAVLDAWARSGDKVAPHRAEQILDHMDDLYRAGNRGVKPDTYTYNTLINAWAKSGENGAAARAEQVLSVMHQRYKDGDSDFKPNTRTHTTVIDAWAKSGEKGAARRAEQILNNMITHFEATGDLDVKPNVHTANAVCNACAFTKMEEDRAEAMQIAFRVFDWLSSRQDMHPDSYTYTILLSVCANLIPKDDGQSRYAHARAFFDRCRDSGHVNDYVLRKLRQTVTEDEYLGLVDYRTDTSAASMPSSWTRHAKVNHNNNKGRKGHGGNGWSNRRRGK